MPLRSPFKPIDSQKTSGSTRPDAEPTRTAKKGYVTDQYSGHETRRPRPVPIQSSTHGRQVSDPNAYGGFPRSGLYPLDAQENTSRGPGAPRSPTTPSHQMPYVTPRPYYAQPERVWSSAINLAGPRPSHAQRQASPQTRLAPLPSQQMPSGRQPLPAPIIHQALAPQNYLPLSQERQIAHDDAHALGLDDMQNRMSLMITALDEDEDFEDSLGLPLPTSSRGAGLTGPIEPTPESRRLLKLPTRSRGVLGGTYFSKVWSYSNARLPPALPPFRVYIPTYPLLCLAARYSLSAYSAKRPPRVSDTQSTTATIHIPPSLRLGTKAMVLALAPCICSTTPTLVLAIRGSATFSDWAVNFRPSPDPPTGLLDDPGNLVHSGFLTVARSMLAAITEQLQRFLARQTDAGTWRERGQLLLTGHSAGGAVASLLYCHLLSQSSEVVSPLKDMRPAFKRIHCLTFGAPPVSLLPLERPPLQLPPPNSAQQKLANEDMHKRWKKNLFFAFLNEGDPVVRADRAFVRSLLELYTSSVPALDGGGKPLWPVPPNTFSNAGKLVVLRAVTKPSSKRTRFLGLGNSTGATAEGQDEAKVEAVIATDDVLRRVVYGDPMMHSMRLYKQRIDMLAVDAVTCS